MDKAWKTLLSEIKFHICKVLVTTSFFEFESGTLSAPDLKKMLDYQVGAISSDLTKKQG